MKRLGSLVAVASLAAAFSLGGCKKKDAIYLEGSLIDAYAIDFDDVRIRLYPSEISVEYLSHATGAEVVALRATLLNDGLKAGRRYDLFTYGAIDRSESLGSPLPDMTKGALDLTEFCADNGCEVGGSFDADFEAEDGSQLGAIGGFRGTLEVVDLDATDGT